MISFGIASLFTVSASGLALLSFIESKKSIDIISEVYVSELNSAYDLAIIAQSITAKSATLLSTKTQPARESVSISINDDLNEMGKMIDSLEQLNISDFESLRKAKESLLNSYLEIDQLISQRIEVDKKQRIITDDLLAGHDEYVSKIEEFIQETNQTEALLLNDLKLIGMTTYSLLLSTSSLKNNGQLKKIKKLIDEGIDEIYKILEIAKNNDFSLLFDEMKEQISSKSGVISLKEKELSLEKSIKARLQLYERDSYKLIITAYSVSHDVKKQIDEATSKNQNQLKKNGIYLIVITIICAFASLMLAFIIGRNIGNRIEILKQGMDLHAQGEGGEISVDGDDEIGQMARTLKIFINKIISRENDLTSAHKQLGKKLNELEAAKNALQESENKFRDFAGVAADWFWEVDNDYRFIFVQGYALESVGISPTDLLGKTFDEVTGNSLDFSLLARHQSFEDVDIRWPLKNGSDIFFRMSGRSIYDSDGNCIGYRGTASDITEAHELSNKLLYRANHDSLTGLHNRNSFESQLKKILENAKYEGSLHTICYLDLDQFKVINDTCGHVAGDELLRQLSLILKEFVSSGDVVARLGGDEFGILLKFCPVSKAEIITNKIREAICSFRFAWEGYNFSVGASIGIAEISNTSVDSSELMKIVDAACYAAKDGGRNRIHVYSEADEDVNKRQGEMQWVSKINTALDNNAFELIGQPIYPINDNDQGYYYEVLIRMRDNNGKLILPGAFLPAAERYGLSPSLDLWLIENTLSWLQKNPDHLNNLYLCSINLSAYSLANENLLNRVKELIKKYDTPADKICFEITETAAISNYSGAKKLIESLKVLGFKFSLDDFGSGFSWLGSLKKLPVDFLKIDGSFVRDICQDPVHKAIVSSINDIGQLMNKKTVAEYVEDEQTIMLLKNMGVDYIQGFAISEPRPLDELTDFFERINHASNMAKIR